ncbi:MAG: multidrug ABC transporter ATPase [Candidatus Microbacterium stercoravium]|uniref:Multidrug ABC transporter ATPase n=1 Tax=Candidatus Microbacterium stercoravium TaxID=2838697 RepID=A0A9D2H6T1_9MICO|nr:multidrug ABC transporter ATPase [Candidatus Microbacterium stercoravium]
MSREDGSAPPVRRIDRILAFASLGILVLSIVCFFATIIGSANGVTDFSTPLWYTVSLLQMVGPIVAFILLLTLLIMSFIRRGRAGRA